MSYYVIDRQHLEGLNINLEPNSYTELGQGPVHKIGQALVDKHARRVIDDRNSGYLKGVTDNDVLLGVRVVMRRDAISDVPESDILMTPYIHDVNIEDEGWDNDGVGKALADRSTELGKIIQISNVRDHGWMMGTYTDFAKPIPMLMLNKIVMVS